MSRRNLRIGLIILVAVVAGAIREFLFINLNYEIDRLEHHRELFYAHSLFRGWVHGFDPGDLALLKWGLAFLFTALMLALCLLLARILFGGARYRRTIVLGFFAIGAVALCLHAMQSISPALGMVSVKLLHLLQYPVILFFLWAAALLRPSRGRQ